MDTNALSLHRLKLHQRHRPPATSTRHPITTCSILVIVNKACAANIWVDFTRWRLVNSTLLWTGCSRRFPSRLPLWWTFSCCWFFGLLFSLFGLFLSLLRSLCCLSLLFLFSLFLLFLSLLFSILFQLYLHLLALLFLHIFQWIRASQQPSMSLRLIRTGRSCNSGIYKILRHKWLITTMLLAVSSWIWGSRSWWHLRWSRRGGSRYINLTTSSIFLCFQSKQV